MIFLKILIVIGVIVTIGILGAGFMSMRQGGEFNRKYGNLLMRARVVSQFVTVLLIALYVLLGD